MTVTESRNSITRMEPDHDSGQGVGARQGSTDTSPDGGGYQDICTGTDVRARAFVTELRRMGLSRMWLEVAALVGPEQFIDLWQIIDHHSTEDYGNLRIRIPRFRRYMRYQRNRYIRSLASIGLKPQEIRARIERELGEQLHVEHVRKLVYRSKT